MLTPRMQSYIAKLPISEFRPPIYARAATPQAPSPVTTMDLDQLPNGVITGSNLVSFDPKVPPAVKTSVTLSLLAAQRVASSDSGILTVDQWVDRHNTILGNLNWLAEDDSKLCSQFSNINVAIHDAILPFLTAAFGGATAAGALIITALKQLQEMDKNNPWITIFNRESNHFEIMDYQFSTVDVTGDQVRLKIAAARLDAFYGTTQVLFVKVHPQHATFQSNIQTLTANASLLADMNVGLKQKLGQWATDCIKALPLAALAATPAPAAAAATPALAAV